jgi:hypothetical protein
MEYGGVGVAPPARPGPFNQEDAGREAVRPKPPPVPGMGAREQPPKRPAEYIEQAGLGERGERERGERERMPYPGDRESQARVTRGGVGAVDRMSEVKDVVKEHAKAAVEDVGQAASEVGRVVSEHARQARRDVSGAAGEVGTALTGREPLPEVRVRDTPELVRPEAGKGIAVAERRVPTAVGARAGGTVGQPAAVQREGPGFRDRVEADVERGKERVREDVERGKERVREDVDRARERISATGERIQEKGERVAERVTEGASRAAGAVRGAAEETVGAVRNAGARARDEARQVRFAFSRGCWAFVCM